MRESDKTAEIVATGVALPVVCIEFLARYGRSPAFAVVAVGSANGEGRLFQPPLTGSRAMSRTLDDRPVAAEEAVLEELKDIAAQRGVETRINRTHGGPSCVCAVEVARGNSGPKAGGPGTFQRGQPRHDGDG